MSSREYKLSDNVDDEFKFELRGLRYQMRYPRTNEVEEIQAMSIELEEAKKNNDMEKVAELNTNFENYLYHFISPIDHDKLIRDALSTENIKVLKNFNTMIKTELAV